jgi:hypothetical protein
MSLSGIFLGVILSVARGFDGELMESLRARLPAGSLSDLEREIDGVRLR